MDITRSRRKHGNLLPAAFSLLGNVPAEAVESQGHGLRPPGAIYNLSIRRVLKAFAAVLDALEALSLTKPDRAGSIGFDPAPLVAAQAELLEAMLAHLEDGFQILKALWEPKPNIAATFADQWLEEAKHPSVRAYKQAIAGYRAAVAGFVNRIKHEHGQLRSIAFYDQADVVAGYFLEGVLADGTLGPDAKMHPGNTAFSYNRDLRFHFTQLYDVGAALKGAVTTALRVRRILPTNHLIQETNDLVQQVASRISTLGPIVFPDEVHKPVPSVRLDQEADDTRVGLTYPSLARLRPPRPGMVITTITLGDGYSTRFQMPYFKA